MAEFLTPKAKRIVAAILTDTRDDITPANYVAEFAPRARQHVSAALDHAVEIGAIVPAGYAKSGQPVYKQTRGPF